MIKYLILKLNIREWLELLMIFVTLLVGSNKFSIVLIKKWHSIDCIRYEKGHYVRLRVLLRTNVANEIFHYLKRYQPNSMFRAKTLRQDVIVSLHSDIMPGISREVNNRKVFIVYENQIKHLFRKYDANINAITILQYRGLCCEST